MMVPIHALQWYRFADTVTILFARGIESFGNTKFLAEIFATCTVEITQYALKGRAASGVCGPSARCLNGHEKV